VPTIPQHASDVGNLALERHLGDIQGRRQPTAAAAIIAHSLAFSPNG
jgi:hypothetical protein